MNHSPITMYTPMNKLVWSERLAVAEVRKLFKKRIKFSVTAENIMMMQKKEKLLQRNGKLLLLKGWLSKKGGANFAHIRLSFLVN